jgi:hypothetical protein
MILDSFDIICLAIIIVGLVLVLIQLAIHGWDLESVLYDD